jgi:hypothetical protein
MLWLPQVGRVVDATIQQFPELAAVDGPLIATTGHGGGPALDRLPVGATMPVMRAGTQVSYRVVAEETLITESAAAAERLRRNPHAGSDIAGWALSMFAMPEIAQHVRDAPFPRLRALIDVVQGATIDSGGDGYRFLLPGADGGQVAVRIEEIPLRGAFA